MSKTRRPDHQRDAVVYGQGFAIELVRQLVVPAFVLDANCRVIVWNNACERLTGVAAADVIGTRNHWRAFYREPRPCLADLVLQNRAAEIDRFYVEADRQPGADVHGGLDFHAENWCVMPMRGTELYLALDAGPIRDDMGRVIAAVETLRDMTEHKRTEEARRLTASVFENSQEGIVITDPSGRILEVNKAFTQVTGYTSDEVRGCSPAVLKSGLHPPTFYADMWDRLNRAGRWQGEVWNRRKSGEIYPQILHINAVKDPETRVSHYIGMFIDITDLRDAQQRLEAMANYDPLTHLPNRVLLVERLHEAMARANRLQRLVAICVLDLDNFKCINDREGQDIGDGFLIEIARRLLSTMRTGDTVARLGGDEFVLLIADLVDAGELETILDRVLVAVSSPFRLGPREVAVSVSMGVTIYPLDDGDPDTLLRHADQSMYQAKQLGRNRYHLFDRQAANELQNRHRDIERIRQGLQHGELRLFYQPKLNMRTGELIGVEALLRWQHPEQGLLSPAAFLPLAESSPLIVDIGEWVLHEALSQSRQWADQGMTIPVGVNLAARHFQDPQFVVRLEAILAAHPEVPPRRLELEILESAALEDIDTMRQVIIACQAMGVTFALDDFGTGYSSLSYLKQLPVDTLKIDRSFVRDMLEGRESLAIIEGVVGLANVFGKTVVAEGVESIEHGLLLMRLGCDRGQGFGIGYPMPANDVLDWARNFKPDWTWGLCASEEGVQLDVPLLLAQNDHLKLIQSVINALEHGGSVPSPEELVDAGACRFGLWYDGEGMRKYGHLAGYAAIDVIHRRIHQVVQQVLRLRDAGDLEGARLVCAELSLDKEEMLDKLNQLQHTPARVSSPVVGSSGRLETNEAGVFRTA